MTDTISVHFLGSDRLFTDRVTFARAEFWRCQIDGVTFELGHYGDDYGETTRWWCEMGEYCGGGETADEAASELEEKPKPLAKVLEPLAHEPSKSLLDELFPDLDKEDEIEIPDGPLPAELLAALSEDE